MSLSAHLLELRRRHEALSQAIEEECKHPAHDQLRLSEMKREKLRLKDEITRLSSGLH